MTSGSDTLRRVFNDSAATQESTAGLPANMKSTARKYVRRFAIGLACAATVKYTTYILGSLDTKEVPHIVQRPPPSFYEPNQIRSFLEEAVYDPR